VLNRPLLRRLGAWFGRSHPCPGSIFIRDGEDLPPVPAQPGKGVNSCVEACLHFRRSRASAGRRTSLEFSGQCCRRRLGIAGGLRRALGAYRWARPLALTHATGTGADVVRSRAQLLAENALVRQQLFVPRRSVKRPAMTPTDRALLVLLAGRVRVWQQALLTGQPETLLCWHRAGFARSGDGNRARVRAVRRSRRRPSP